MPLQLLIPKKQMIGMEKGRIKIKVMSHSERGEKRRTVMTSKLMRGEKKKALPLACKPAYIYHYIDIFSLTYISTRTRKICESLQKSTMHSNSSQEWLGYTPIQVE